MAFGLWSRSKNTRLSFFTAPISVLIGVVTMTAPMVPQRTMMAAVTCATSLTLPPSITRPPRIPPIARTSPPSDARSGLPPDFLGAAGAFSAICFVHFAGCPDLGPAFRRRQGARKGAGYQGSPVLDDAIHYFLGGFKDYDLLPRCQRHDRVRGHIHMFDEIRVQDQRGVIQACELDHKRYRVQFLIGTFPDIFR